MKGRDLAAAIAGRTEQAGIFVATASVPRSFQRTLMPRSTVDQAIVTGGTMAATYGIAALTHDSIEAVAQWARPGDPSEVGDDVWRRRTAAIDAGAMLAGTALQYAAKQQPGEALPRGGVRTAGLMIFRTGLAGLSVSALQELAARYERRTGRTWLSNAPLALIGGALFAAGDRLVAERRSAQEPSTEDGWEVDTGKTLAIGVGVAAGLAGIATLEQKFATTLADRLARVFPGRERGWRNVGHLLALGAMDVAVVSATRRVFGRIEAAATTYEGGVDEPPESELVSGGPGSLVPFESLSRQGRRHVLSYVRREWIDQIMGEPAKAHPIRIFVGLDSAPTEEERALLAMEELERTGAFDRGVLLMTSPTGTGYVNYVAVESLEYLTRGDCATVTLQYSKRPSPLSLGRVNVGRRQNGMLVQLICDRIQSIKDPAGRPKFVLFGESLGAHTSQDAFVHRGTRGLIDRNVDGALWIGTPQASEWKEEVLGKPRFDVDRSLVGVFNDIDEYEALPEAERDRIRYVLLTHYNDAVAYFGPEILISRPSWLGEPDTRPPGVSRSIRYGPVVTFLQTLVDMKNSANVIPGQFEAKGHDYRADLLRFVKGVFKLDASDEQLERVEDALRRFELWRAEHIKNHDWVQAAAGGPK